MVDLSGKIGVVGLGTMGRSIIKLFLTEGFDVVILSRTPESGKRGLAKLTAELRSRVKKGKLTEAEFESMVSKITMTNDPAALAGTEFIIEAIYEDIRAKGNLLRNLEAVIPKKMIIATNTSSLSIEELSGNLKNPSRFLGMHFFNPAEVMKLVEVRRSKKTDDATFSAASELAKRIGKTPINTPDLPGLYVNRILFPMLLESISVLESIKSPVKEIDEALKLGANLPMGPLELCDFIGNDIVLNISNVLLEHTGDKRFKPPKLLERMVEDGKLGRKTGKGFYNY